MNQPLTVNADRLHASLADLARIGATPAGGVTRLALSDEDRQARDLLGTWLRDAGLEPKFDDVGNISAIRPGRESGPPVLLGSHIDTVVRGGRYDGALGVLGALEVIRTLNDHGVETRLPIGLVNWTNEEGVRFEPAMTCSGVVSGRFTPEYVGERTDRAGLRFADELARIGYQGDAANRPLPATAYLELHIEQGPVLESQNLPAGVVGGIVGITWNEVTITGQADHAGPSPMHLRRDALTAAAEVILGIEQIAKRRDETAVATVGRIAAAAERDQHDSWAGHLQRRLPPLRSRRPRAAGAVPASTGRRGFSQAVGRSHDRALLDQRGDTVRYTGTGCDPAGRRCARHLDR